MTLPDLPDAAARDRVSRDLSTTLFVEAGAGSGKTRALVDRVAALVDDGVPLRAIAAITFTEKAATELRDRVRGRLESIAADPDTPPARRERARVALGDVDGAAISTLHAFAQRILREHPLEVGLPPRFDVLDGPAAADEFEARWQRTRDGLLNDDSMARTLLLAFAVGITVADLRALAAALEPHTDRLGEPGRMPAAPAEPPPVDRAAAQVRAHLRAALALREECRDPSDLLATWLSTEVEPYLEQLDAVADDETAALETLAAAKPTLKAGSKGRAANWPDKDAVLGALADAREVRQSTLEEVTTACLHRLLSVLVDAALEGVAARRSAGELTFHDLLVGARDLLRGPHGADVRAELRSRYRRLLLDEFQDTDPLQIDLATLIAAPPTPAAAAPPAVWSDLDTDDGRLFFVGDPKQSIYRFRRADIALFLAARERFGPPLTLTTNFRSSPTVLAWINAVFARLIVASPEAQPGYAPVEPAPGRAPAPQGPGVAALGLDPHDDGCSAAELRDAEAREVAAAVRSARTWQIRAGDGHDGVWRAATYADIAVLLPTRTALPDLEAAFDRAGIPYRAETSSLVYATEAVSDLLTAAVALADPTDELALVSTLRSQLYGCGDDDLVRYRLGAGGRLRIAAPPPATVPADDPVAEALAHLTLLHEGMVWWSPAELLDRLVRDRRLLELGYAGSRPRDLWRRVRFVIDQARMWQERTGGTLRAYLSWVQAQAADGARVAETLLPETDDDAVRILTIHGAKGLEFPVVIVAGMTGPPGGAPPRVEVAVPTDGPVGVKVGSDRCTPAFDAYAAREQELADAERVRLLYVACTRAEDHLVVSLHRKATPVRSAHRRSGADLLADASSDLATPAVTFADDEAIGQAAPLHPPLPAFTDWQRLRAEALATSTQRRSVGASDAALLGSLPRQPRAAVAAATAETAAGGAKHPRDLELPAWQKGRYGTAIGRAVHGVLQTIDLATGEPLAETVAAQAAAEGVLGREADLTHLVQAALRAPAVRAALDWPRWRETYVATRVGERILEGYVDLLYRTDRGLVVVDYKTASSTRGLAERVEVYRSQGAAYALGLTQATGERVATVVFVFLTPDGARELALRDLDDAVAALTHQLSTADLH